MSEPVIALAMAGRSPVSFAVLKQWIAALREVHWPGPTYLMEDIYGAGHWIGVVPVRNLTTHVALKDESWTHMLWIDADHMVNHHIFSRLRQHAQPAGPAVVCGPYFSKVYPHEVQAFYARTPAGVLYVPPTVLVQWYLTGELPPSLPRVDTPGGGPLVPIAGGGTGCMLIRRDVLERMAQRRVSEQDPDGTMSIWRADRVDPREVRRLLEAGEHPSGVMTEDILFCLDCADELKEQVWLDLDPRMETGHQGEQTVDRRQYVAAHTVPQGTDPDTVKLPAGYATLPAHAKDRERERRRRRLND